MLDRLKASARQKLQRAVEEVVQAELASTRQRLEDMHAESLAKTQALSDRLSAQLDEVNDRFGPVFDRLHELEWRARRDIAYALDIDAIADSAAFVREHMPKAQRFWHPQETLRFALGEVKGTGLALEFGVASGTTLKLIAEALSEELRVVGFDTFEGLPEVWRTDFPAGEFAQETIPDVPGAELVAGLFEDTLPGFLAGCDDAVGFLHLDADLYSSTKTVLDLIGDRLRPGAVVVFDEFFNFPGWQEHEYLAWSEFVGSSGRSFEYLAYTGSNEQVVVRLD
jgi:predicted O-methyltransferase YrrM